MCNKALNYYFGKMALGKVYKVFLYQNIPLLLEIASRRFFRDGKSIKTGLNKYCVKILAIYFKRDEIVPTGALTVKLNPTIHELFLPHEQFMNVTAIHKLFVNDWCIAVREWRSRHAKHSLVVDFRTVLGCEIKVKGQQGKTGTIFIS